MKHIADKLSGRSDPGHCPWSVRGAGRDQMPLVTQAALMGGDVRVGLKDPLTIGAGKLAAGNDAQVRPVRDVLESLGLEVATPAEARQVLGLKGKDRVPR